MQLLFADVISFSRSGGEWESQVSRRVRACLQEVAVSKMDQRWTTSDGWVTFRFTTAQNSPTELKSAALALPPEQAAAERPVLASREGRYTRPLQGRSQWCFVGNELSMLTALILRRLNS